MNLITRLITWLFGKRKPKGSFTVIAGEYIDKGQAVYLDNNGKGWVITDKMPTHRIAVQGDKIVGVTPFSDGSDNG